MILGIGDVKRLAIQHHALRSKERGAFERAVVGAVRSRADGFKQRAVQFCYDQAIVIRIGDEQPFALGVGQDFPRKRQR